MSRKSNCYSHTNSDSYANTNIHSPAYSDTKAGTYWKTSPNPAPSALAGGDELVYPQLETHEHTVDFPRHRNA